MTTVATPVRIGGEPPRTAAARRWRTWRMPVLVLSTLLVTAALAAAIQPPTSTEPYAVDNAGPNGVRALAQVLGEQGVRVTETGSLDAALAAAAPGTTLAVVETYFLLDEDLERLARTESDLVLIAPDEWALDIVTYGRLTTAWDVADESRTAECDDPDAEAAGELIGAAYEVTAIGEATVCFPGGGDPRTGSYAVTTAGGRTIRVLADASPLTNARVAEAGNAALALRMLGHHDRLTWYRPTMGTALTGSGGPGIGDQLPPSAGPVALWAALVVLVAALWRGRGFGRVVGEPLPVTVRAAETTRGRGRLYRRGRSRGHAAASLRAGTARRAAARLGLPRTAGADAVLTALTHATGRPLDQLAGLLYGPPPTDDTELVALARALDQLESEVHHP